MSESNPDPASPAVERPRMDADIVCAGFGPAFGLMLQIATSKEDDGERT
jgi:hypothetical protein